MNADAEVETEPVEVEPTVAATQTVGVDAQELAAKMQMLKTEVSTAALEFAVL